LLRRLPISVTPQSLCDGADSFRPDDSSKTGIQDRNLVAPASNIRIVFLTASISRFITSGYMTRHVDSVVRPSLRPAERREKREIDKSRSAASYNLRRGFRRY